MSVPIFTFLLTKSCRGRCIIHFKGPLIYCFFLIQRFKRDGPCLQSSLSEGFSHYHYIWGHLHMVLRKCDMLYRSISNLSLRTLAIGLLIKSHLICYSPITLCIRFGYSLSMYLYGGCLEIHDMACTVCCSRFYRRAKL